MGPPHGCVGHRRVQLQGRPLNRPRLSVSIESVTRLVFDDGSPVRAASAIVELGDGWLVAQDDATHAAWWREGSVEAVRIFEAVEGHEVFTEEQGTKHLKPDVETGCRVEVEGGPGVLLLGSGSSAARMRGALVTLRAGRPEVRVADLSRLYAAAAAELDLAADELNLEGACVLDGALRWFHRGLPSAGLPTSSVDVPLTDVLALVEGARVSGAPGSGTVRRYDLGAVQGVSLAATDAVALTAFPGADRPVLVSAAAEDTPNARDDGPVVGSAVAIVDGDRTLAAAELPMLDGRVAKVEGLALVEETAAGAVVIATVDADDPAAPSLALRLRLRWPEG